MAATAPLELEWETFEKNRAALVAAHEGHFALIHRDKLVNTFVDEQDAIAAGYDQFGNVPFLVVRVSSMDIPADFMNNQIGV